MEILINQTVNSLFPLTFEISQIVQETEDIFTIDLISEDNKPFIYKPGQFNMVYLFGKGEVPVSISGDPNIPEKLVHTIRAVGSITNAMVKLKKGDVLGIRGPFGNPWPVDLAKGKDLLIIAGGLGLAPLRPVIYQAISERADFEKVFILYGTREPEQIIFEKEILKWKSRFDLEILVTVDHALQGWKGNVGVITTLIKKTLLNPENLVAMVCGPEIMMRFSAMELEKKGLDPKNIFLSMERNMKCATGFCGHCQFGPEFICKDGPVFSYEKIKKLIEIREL